MADPRSDHDRIDLRGLGLGPDAQREDEVLRAVMARVGDARTQRASVPPIDPPLPALFRLRRVVFAAAAVLAAIATATVVTSGGRGAPSNDVIATWTHASHVPTNGELLAAYQGYRP
jgi:hypothetical protein